MNNALNQNDELNGQKGPYYDEWTKATILRFLADSYGHFERMVAGLKAMWRDQQDHPLCVGNLAYAKHCLSAIREMAQRVHYRQNHLLVLTDDDIRERLAVCHANSQNCERGEPCPHSAQSTVNTEIAPTPGERYESLPDVSSPIVLAKRLTHYANGRKKRSLSPGGSTQEKPLPHHKSKRNKRSKPNP